MLAGATAAALAMSPAGAQTDLKFALDWKFEGPSAPYFVAIDKGYYKAEGLNVTIDSGPGSVAGIARIAAGTYPLGFFDINSLVKFRDQVSDVDGTKRHRRGMTRSRERSDEVSPAARNPRVNQSPEE